MNEFPFLNCDRMMNNPIIKEFPNMWSLEYIFNENNAKIVKEYIKDTKYGSEESIQKVL